MENKKKPILILPFIPALLFAAGAGSKPKVCAFDGGQAMFRIERSEGVPQVVSKLAMKGGEIPSDHPTCVGRPHGRLRCVHGAYTLFPEFSPEDGDSIVGVSIMRREGETFVPVGNPACVAAAD